MLIFAPKYAERLFSNGIVNITDMAQTNQSSQKLSALQLELLKIYSFEPSEEELIELKNLIARFFATRFAEKAAEAAKARHITDADLDKWLEEDGR